MRMVHFRLESALQDFRTNVRQSQRLAVAARQWNITSGGMRPRFTIIHRNMLVEFAFLRSYLAWERFLEETFILFLIGKRPQRRRRVLKCYVAPKNRNHALEMILPEGRRYVDWDSPDLVCTRAKRFFAGGEPFESALAPRLNLLNELQIIRNAIAHRSIKSERKFHQLVRDKLGYLPAGISVGSFLETLVPRTHPPLANIDHYLDRINVVASIIVP